MDKHERNFEGFETQVEADRIAAIYRDAAADQERRFAAYRAAQARHRLSLPHPVRNCEEAGRCDKEASNG